MRQLILLAVLSALATIPAAAATITVNDLGDSGSGTCATACTLRDAISSASPGDTITFASTLTYPATITLAGQELLVYKNLDIEGPGAGLLSISGNQQSRIIEIAANASVSVSDISLTAGAAIGADGGLSTAPRAADGGPAYGGAALVNAGSTLQLVACALTNNLAQGGNGGTSFAPASTQGSGGPTYGGAIYSAGTLLLEEANVVSNSAIGGAANFAPPNLLTIDGNGGSASGGAIYATGLTEITNSQLLNNSTQGGFSVGVSFAQGGNGGSAQGGALALSGFTSLAFVSAFGNSVTAAPGGFGNPSGSSGAAAGADLYATATVLSRSSALTSAVTGVATSCSAATIVTQGANFDADSSCPNFSLHGDAKLQLVTSGGATFAFPLWGSPLIDAAADCSDAFGVLLTNDVRGGVRPLDGNADGVTACDIGAVESDELFANGFD